MDEQTRRAEAYTDLVHLIAMGPREHNFGMMQHEGGWAVGHLPNCWACRAEDLLEQLDEL